MRFSFPLRNTDKVVARMIIRRILFAHHIGDIVDGARHVGQVGHGGLHVIWGQGVVAGDAEDQENQYHFGKEFKAANFELLQKNKIVFEFTQMII